MELTDACRSMAPALPDRGVGLMRPSGVVTTRLCHGREAMDPGGAGQEPGCRDAIRVKRRGPGCPIYNGHDLGPAPKILLTTQTQFI
jgi:hypothetical protein